MYLIVPLTIAIHAGYIGSKVAVSLLALHLGASEVVIGLLAALYGAAPLVLGVHSGRLADTVGMRPPLLIGAVLVVAAMLGGFFFQNLPGLFMVATLMGSGFVYFNVSIQNLAGFQGSPERRARNFAVLSIAYSVSSFVGPMYTGFAIEYLGHGAAFLGYAVMGTLAIAAILAFPGLTKVQRPAGSASGRSAMDLLRDPPLRRVIIASGLMVAAGELYVFYMPIHGHAVGLSASSIGMVLGTYAAAGFVARFLLPVVMRRLPGPRVLSLGMLIAAVGYLVLPLAPHFAPLVAISCAIGLAMGVAQPLSMTMAFDRSPAGRTGEVTGLRLTANNVARVVIPVVSGSLGAAFGSAPVFWMNAANLAAISWLARR